MTFPLDPGLHAFQAQESGHTLLVDPSAQTVSPAGARTEDAEHPAPPLATWIPGKYVSLVSFKRDGTPVATPLWFVVEGDRLLAMTGAQSAKVKRIRRNPEVTVAPCKASGRLTGEPIAARAEILPPGEVESAQRLMARKYRVDRIVILPVYNLVQRLRGKRESRDGVVLAITPAGLG